jgi:hypothetical protein
MSRFIDVQPYSWYYNHIEEAADLTMADGSKLLEGIEYNAFQEGKEAIDFTYSEKSAHSEKVVNFVVKATDSNPLIAFVDGISVVLDEVTPDTTKGTTRIKFRRMIPANAVVRLVYGGEPQLVVKIITEYTWLRNSASIDSYYKKVYKNSTFDIVAFDGIWFTVKEYPSSTDVKYIYNDENVVRTTAGIRELDNGTPVMLPYASLNITGDYQYVYDPFYLRNTETLSCNGVQLKRVENSSLIKESSDYSIENGRLYVHYSLNNSIITGTVLTRYEYTSKPRYIKVQPHSDNIKYDDRFFPNLELPRIDFICLLNKLRMNLYYRYSDTEPPRSTKTSSKYLDVQNAISSATKPYWWEHFRDLEDMRCADGSFLFNGEGHGKFGIDTPVTRAEAAVLLNRFRKIMVEAFK